MEKTNVICLLILFYGFMGATDGCCLEGVDTLGFTVPKGDIILEYGQSLNITCNLNRSEIKKYGENASSLLFFTRNQVPIPKEMIEIINSSSIQLYIERPDKVESDSYFCYLNDSSQTTTNNHLVCMNNVAVGVRPQNVTDFSCIGRNYQNLTCTWHMPNNYIKTTSELSYNFTKGRVSPDGGRKGKHKDTSLINTQLTCPIQTRVGNVESCFWNISTTPQYRHVQPTYVFTLNMTNELGRNSHTFVFDHFKHVIPNPPENLSAVPTSAHSIHLSWNVPADLTYFEPGLHHRILFQCEYSEKKWHVGGYIDDDASKVNMSLEFDLNHLKYAHALYDIRVSMRSAAAKDDESMWSDYSWRTERTMSEIPDCPPRTTQGAFEITNKEFNRDVSVYWQPIGQEQMNGKHFIYEIVVENNRSMKPTELFKSYAKFENMAVANYEISIWSKNENGTSLQKSTIIIPEYRLMEPRNFIKLDHPGVSPENDLYQFSWDPPRGNGQNVTNYTIFWCNNERDRPYQCMDNFNWTILPGDTFKYNLSLPRSNIYQFAISANNEYSSSGMTWTDCTFIANKTIGKMRNVWINLVGATFIELGWKLECSDSIPIVQGYVIDYCPIKSTQEKECTNNTQKLIIDGDQSTQSARVTNLKPYTMYQLTVRVILSQNDLGPAGYSQPSDTMRNTTSEAAPSTPPLDILILNVTNSSISLKWSPPRETNGVLKYYLIHYRTETSNSSKEVDKNWQNYTITGLKSFEKYWISMQACTVLCSKTSGENFTVTKMWLPGVIERPNVIFQNDTVTTIGWKKPNPPRGEINYYQVKFTHNNLENVSMEPDVNVTNAQNYSIEDCGESGKYNTFFVSIRAVNVIDGEHKAGPWSEPLESYCRHYSSLLYIIISVSLIFVAAGLFLGFTKMYAWCKVMQDVEVKLPPGLAPVVDRDLVLWGSEKHPDDIDRSSRADEQLLLEKITEVRTSGDSSGCSSGHESISSSVESTTHMSVDSGTDQPRNMNEENRKNSLRQRNVSSKGYVLPDAIPTNSWATKSAPAPAENYCVLGVDPTNNTEGDTPYQPMTDISSTLSSPYISCDLPPSIPPSYLSTADLIKTPNPGYVPYSAAEPASKNTGYVVAGLKKDLLAGDLIPSVIKTDDKPYMKLGDAQTIVKDPQHPWQPPADIVMNKTGYVSVGDAPPPKTIKEITKGYVPHRQFEAKALKED